MEANTPGKEPTLRQSKSALLEAAQAAIADQKTKAATAPPPGLVPSGHGRTWFRSILVALILTGGTILALQPGWLIGPTLPKESEEIQAASATLALVEAVSHVRAYAATTGRLPSKLADVGVVNPAISLRPLDGGTFEVSYLTGGQAIRLKSTDSLKTLVVDAIRTLQRRT